MQKGDALFLRFLFLSINNRMISDRSCIWFFAFSHYSKWMLTFRYAVHKNHILLLINGDAYHYNMYVLGTCISLKVMHGKRFINKFSKLSQYIKNHWLKGSEVSSSPYNLITYNCHWKTNALWSSATSFSFKNIRKNTIIQFGR